MLEFQAAMAISDLETQRRDGPPVGRPEAAAAIWNWREGPDPRALAKGRGHLRAVIEASVGLAIGGLLFWLGHPTFAIVVWSISGFVFLAHLFSPHTVHAAIQRGMGWLGRAIGQAVTLLTLAPLFYTFFMGFGRLFRRGRHDRLQRRFDPEAPSHWHTRNDEERTEAFYRRQF
jgi:hypothetical protein